MSSYRERVAQQLAQEIHVADAEKEEAKKRFAKEAGEANRRLELAHNIVEQWDSIGVPHMLREINSDIWDNLGEYYGNENDNIEVSTDREHGLIATMETGIEEKWQPIKEKRFGSYKEWHGYGGDWGYGDGEYIDRFGFHEKMVAKRLVGYDSQRKSVGLIVRLYTGGSRSDKGFVRVADEYSKIVIPDSSFNIVQETVYNEGTSLILSFSQDNFSINDTTAFIDSVLLASSVERAKDFIPRMREQQVKLRGIEGRMGRAVRA